MAQPAVARETLCALRETIARLEGENLPALARHGRDPTRAGFRQPPRRKDDEPAKQADQKDGDCSGLPQPDGLLRLGDGDIDTALGGGLPLAAMTEIRVGETRDTGAGTGFALALAALAQKAAGLTGESGFVIWIGEPMAYREAGLPYGPGLRAHGIDPARFLAVRPRTLAETLWAAETATGLGERGPVIVELRGNPDRFGLTESRRLHLRARAAGRPVFLLRQAGQEEAGAGPLRFLARSAPAAARPLPDGSRLAGSLGHAAFSIVLEKSRLAGPLSFTLEWNPHDRRFSSDPTRLDTARFDPAHFNDSGPAAGPPDPRRRPAASGDGPDRADALGRVVAFERAS